MRRSRIARSRALARARILTFAQAEGDEAVRGIVGREADLDAIARNHADPEPAHAPGQLRRHGLSRLERDLIAPAAEDLLDGSVRLDEIFSGQDGRQGSRCFGPTSPSALRVRIQTRPAARAARDGARV